MKLRDVRLSAVANWSCVIEYLRDVRVYWSRHQAIYILGQTAKLDLQTQCGANRVRLVLRGDELYMRTTRNNNPTE